jgi:hypothetical protein
MLAKVNVFSTYLDLGELKTVVDNVVEFLQGSNVPESRVAEFLQDNRAGLFMQRGERVAALELY